MNRSTVAVALSLPIWAPGCGSDSLENDVLPEVLTASIQARPSTPTGLADVQIHLALNAGVKANRTVTLGRVLLQESVLERQPTELQDLAMSFPGDFSGKVTASDRLELTLVNTATTNADLGGLCGRLTHLVVTLHYPDAPNTTTLSPPFPVLIACQE